MLMQYVPTMLDDMDFYNIDRKCWQCAHFQQWNSAQDRCASEEQVQAVRDMLGVDFTRDLILPVTQMTDAGLCSEFCLSRDEAVRLEILDRIDDARVQSQRHADHYRHLRREHAH